MRAVITIALTEMRKQKGFTLLITAVCVIALNTVLNSVTSVSSAFAQRKIFEENIGTNLEKTLHLKYNDNGENNEFVAVLEDFFAFMRDLDGVSAVGKFDMTGTYFSELRLSEEYGAVNAELLKNTGYKSFPNISRLLRADESVLQLVRGGLSGYPETKSGACPIYASEFFCGILPLGTRLTEETIHGAYEYEVVGYIPKNTKWAGDELVRFPMISLDGYFAAPFTEEAHIDIWAQLPCLHNTYVFLSDGADVEYLKKSIAGYTAANGFSAEAHTLAEEYSDYNAEISSMIANNFALAVFITVMSLSSMIAVFTADAVLQRKRFGIFIANGFTLRYIAACISFRIALIVTASALAAWLMQYVYARRALLFGEILAQAHIRYTLPLCGAVILVLTGIASLLPMIKIFGYKPCELIGGDENAYY